jgi:hypothetical protein
MADEVIRRVVVAERTLITASPRYRRRTQLLVARLAAGWKMGLAMASSVIWC